MTQLFGEGVAQLCGIACALLGWRPEEFWGATPAELATALLPPDHVIEGPSRDVMEELRLRFPDQ